MPKTRRRQAGEGCISEYRLKPTKAGALGELRFLIKYKAPTADGLGHYWPVKRGFMTRTAAANYLREAISNVEKGVHVPETDLKLGPYLTDRFLPSLRLEASTEASYRKNIRLHVIPYLGSVKLSAVTGQRLTALYKTLETSGRKDSKDGGLSARTVRYIHTIIHKALGDAVEAGLLRTNPADKAKPPTARAAKSPEMHCWTAGQLSAFLGWAERVEDDLLPAWHLLAATGMRRGEALALQWRDVDFDSARLSVRRNAVLVRQDGRELIVVKPPKSGEARVVDLDSRTITMLKAHRVTLASIGLELARGDGFVLPDYRTGAVRHPERFSRTFNTRVAQARKALGVDAVPAIRLHDLRHTHATILLATEHPRVVQERLGHATVAITMQIYTHVLPTMQRQAATAFGDAVYGA